MIWSGSGFHRFAQQTDAGQLTRTLLLAPRATANVKPNLQIVADDVKCSHGAAISDLEEDQLFYFQARGIDLKTAREALVFSFGSEVISRIPFEPIRKSVTSQLKHLLATQWSNGSMDWSCPAAWNPVIFSIGAWRSQWCDQFGWYGGAVVIFENIFLFRFPAFVIFQVTTEKGNRVSC